ncbi:unnamed protein product, partial [Closterium sp. NIES-53]
MAAPAIRIQAAVVLALLLSSLIIPPASAIRLGMRAQVLEWYPIFPYLRTANNALTSHFPAFTYLLRAASVSGPLVMCGSGETEGSAQLELVR